MKIPNPPNRYDPVYEAQRNKTIETISDQSFKRVSDVEIFLPQRLILRSPDGTKFVISVDDSGVLSATAL